MSQRQILQPPGKKMLVVQGEIKKMKEKAVKKALPLW